MNQKKIIPLVNIICWVAIFLPAANLQAENMNSKKNGRI